MVQGKFKSTGGAGKKAKTKSKGGQRKLVGKAGKSKGTTTPNNRIREEAGRFLTRSIEADLASRLPSDQRDKLTVLRNAPNLKPVLSGLKKKHMKKPLTRGRKRKQGKAKGTINKK